MTIISPDVGEFNWLTTRIELSGSKIIGREMKGLTSNLPDFVSERAFGVDVKSFHRRTDILTFTNTGSALILLRLHMRKEGETKSAGIKHYVLVGNAEGFYTEYPALKNSPYVVTSEVGTAEFGGAFVGMVEVIILRIDQEEGNISKLVRDKFVTVTENEHVVFKFVKNDKRWSLKAITLNTYRE